MRVEPPVSVPIAISPMPCAGNRAAGGRAAGCARGRPDCRRAELRIGADPGERKLAHVGFRMITAPASRTRSMAGASAVASCRAWSASPNLRAHLARGIEQVLDGDDRTVERAERFACCGARICGVGSSAGGFGIDSETGAFALPAGSAMRARAASVRSRDVVIAAGSQLRKREATADGSALTGRHENQHCTSKTSPRISAYAGPDLTYDRSRLRHPAPGSGAGR